MNLVCLRRLCRSHTRSYSVRSLHHLIYPKEQSDRSLVASDMHLTYAGLSYRPISRCHPHLLYSTLQSPQQNIEVPQEAPKQRRKTKRPPAAKTSLRRVAVEAETSRHGKSPNGDALIDLPATKVPLQSKVQTRG